MSISPRRNDLLQRRVDGLTGSIERTLEGEPKALVEARVAAWQLREVLPILAIEGSTSAKVAHRLRKMTRRLAKVLEIEAHLRILEGLGDIDRTSRQAVTRVKNELRRRKTKSRLPAIQKKIALDVRRVVKALEPVLAAMAIAGDTSAGVRDMRWAVKARAARRSATVRTSVEEAGSVYLPARLRAVRRAVRKLRFGVELVGELAGGMSAADLSAIVHTQGVLDDLAETESLIKRIRHQQTSLAGSEIKSWQELDSLVGAVENRCRRLHGRYMRDRALLLPIAARLGARATAAGAVKRKVG